MVILLERQARPSERGGETLPPFGESLLRQINVFQAFEAQHHIRSTTVRSSWMSQELREVDYSLHPLGFWWHLDRRDFDSMLFQQTQRSGVDSRRPAKVAEISRSSKKDLWRLKVQFESQCSFIEAKFLIDATGRASFVSRRLGAKRRRLDRLVAIVGIFDVPSITEKLADSALIEATERGWWYTGPVSASRRIAMFFTDADLLRAHSILNVWISQYKLTTHVQKELADCELQQNLKVYVADSSVLSTCSGAAWLAVGDAAVGRDPLSSSGLLYAVESGIFASTVANEFLAGNPQPLAAYDQGVKRSFAEYAANREHYYSRVTRWQNSPFWMRRMPEAKKPPLLAP